MARLPFLFLLGGLASAEVFRSYSHIKLLSASSCEDACLQIDRECIAGVSVSYSDISESFRCSSTATDQLTENPISYVNQTDSRVYCRGGTSACGPAAASDNQPCTCSNVDVSIDLDADDTMTYFMARLMFNISSIFDGCPSLLNMRIQEYASELSGIRSIYNYNARKGVYITFSTNATHSGAFDGVIKRIFMDEFNIVASVLMLESPGHALVVMSNSPSFTNDYSQLHGIDEFDAYAFVGEPARVTIRLGQFVYGPMLTSDVMAYKDASALRHQFRDVLYPGDDAPTPQRVSSNATAVTLQYANRQLDPRVPFYSFATDSCSAVTNPDCGRLGFYMSEHIYRETNRSVDILRTPESGIIETFFGAVDEDQFGPLRAVLPNVVPVYIFNTTTPEIFPDARVIRGGIVAIPMQRYPSGVSGKTSAGFMLWAAADSCADAEGMRRRIADASLAGWTGIVSCR